MDVVARTDDTHREILAMLPDNLFDLSDLESGVALLMGLLGSAVAEVPATVVVEDHFAQTADGRVIDALEVAAFARQQAQFGRGQPSTEQIALGLVEGRQGAVRRRVCEVFPAEPFEGHRTP